MAEPALQPIDFSSHSSQMQSPLFSLLPAEIRQEIFAYALSPSEDMSRAYSRNTHYTRPGNYAPQRICTELLRTCKRIYAEAWFMPFAYAEHIFYLAADKRAPDNRLDRKKFPQALEMMHRLHGDDIRMGPVRIYSQLYILEPGRRLKEVFDIPHFRPRVMHLTIRYTDFWYWEDNRLIYVDPTFINNLLFPESLVKITVDFECLERRSDEVDILAAAAVEKWIFTRKDGRTLTARKEDTTVTKWTGSSLFGGERWIRDEMRPGQLDYYFATVTWKLHPQEKDKEPGPRQFSDIIAVPRGHRGTPPPYWQWSSIPENVLDAAKVPIHMPAPLAMVAVNDYHRIRDDMLRRRAWILGRGFRIGGNYR